MAIASVFEQGMVTIQDTRRREKLAGISLTDSSNHQVLLRRAEQVGLAAQFSAEFVLELCHAGRISRRRLDGLLRDFVANGRYSEEFMEALILRR